MDSWGREKIDADNYLKEVSRYIHGERDFIVAPSMAEFDGLVAEAGRQAKKAGLKRTDVSDAIARVRREK